MKKSILSIVLILLSIGLWIGPIVTAFSTHDWDFVNTVAPSQNQLDDVRNRFDDLVDENFSQDTFQISESSVDGSGFSLTVVFTSPFGFSLTIEEFKAVLSEGNTELGSIELLEEVKIGPREKETIRFSGSLTEEGKLQVQNGEIPETAEISEGTLKLSAAGVTVEVDLERISEGNEIF